jgi:hypothetical protein
MIIFQITRKHLIVELILLFIRLIEKYIISKIKKFIPGLDKIKTFTIRLEKLIFRYYKNFHLLGIKLLIKAYKEEVIEADG